MLSTYKNLPSDGLNAAFAYTNKMLSEGKSFSNSNMMASTPPAFGDIQADQMAKFLMNDSITVADVAATYDKELAKLVAEQ